MSSKNKNIFHIEDRDVYCRNGCQFYGNPEWEGYCSKCYKDIRNRQALQSSSGGSRATDFHTFEGKKSSQQRRAKTIKEFISKSTNSIKENATFSMGTSSGTGSRNKVAVEGLNKLREELRRTVHLESEACQSVIKLLSSAIEDMESMLKKGESIKNVSLMVQNIYTHLEERISQTKEDDQLDQAVDLCETFLMTYTYDLCFGILSTEDESCDFEFLQKVRSLFWIQPWHLEFDLNDIDLGVREYMDDAITQFITIDSMRSPKEKLARVKDATTCIFKMIDANRADKGKAAADDLVPAMIYVILKANPTRLKTNIKYINLFRFGKRVSSGWVGYYFTTLIGAVSYIERIYTEKLQMDPKIFDQCMNGMAPPLDPFTEGARLMEHNAMALENLQVRQKRLADATEQLKSTLDSLQEDIVEQVKSSLQETELSTKPHEYQIPSQLDIRCVPTFLRETVVRREIVQSPGESNLPSPLQPEVVHGDPEDKDSTLNQESSS